MSKLRISLEVIFDYFTRFCYVIPILQMLFLSLLSLFDLSNIDYFNDEKLILLQPIVGESWCTILIYVAFFFHKRLRYCLITRCFVLGLLLNRILYQLFTFVGREVYDNLFTLSSLFIVILCYWIFLYRNKK